MTNPNPVSSPGFDGAQPDRPIENESFFEKYIEKKKKN